MLLNVVTGIKKIYVFGFTVSIVIYFHSQWQPDLCQRQRQEQPPTDARGRILSRPAVQAGRGAPQRRPAAMRCLHKHQLIAPACFNSAMTCTGWDVTLMAVHTMTFSQQQEAVNSSKVSAGIDTKWMYTEAKDSHLSEPDLQDLLIQCGQIQQYHKELSWDSLTKVNKVTFLDCLLLLCLCCCC